ncbi:Nmad3 family putative nucleotide modification protein [Halonotius roseus]|uniref:Nucleotide modification associated domain-containing protein n=1 Tax=Halonotius roseus TaxID=2511997 RepID=A0A544QMB2_9EURY|nr:hypothetical protein [Halonotius roseus]TQQ79736.1 hypothetical protein EWF95_11675 [Halonotius roseus]
MARALAINVAANTNIPGVRGPIYPDGSFVYLPIPEREAIDPAASVPTYDDLLAELPTLPFELPADSRDRAVHLDPEFAGYPCCDSFTYGDEHGVKAGPISELEPGDSLYFYATLTTHEPPEGVDLDDAVGWVAPEWGAYLIGEFRIAEVLDSDACQSLSPAGRAAFASNAHRKRAEFDAKVLVRGGEESRLFDRAVPLSTPESGAAANKLVTELSNDSGNGPWWRRQLWFDAEATATLRSITAAGDDRRPVADRLGS